jgi:cytochrome c
MTVNAHPARWAPRTAKILAAASIVLLTLPSLAAESGAGGKSSPGQAPFNNQCRTCHTVKEGDNRLGPSLHSILGAKAGANSGYASYSQAMKTAGVTWDEATLDRFIADPEAVIPNNNMKPFKGIPDAAVRKAIVAYLKAGG